MLQSNSGKNHLMMSGICHIAVAKGSEKSFGLVVGASLSLYALMPLLLHASVRSGALVFGLAFVLVGWLRPELLILPNWLWFKFGLLLGAITSPLVMVLVYFGFFLPIGLAFRMVGSDPLRLRRAHSVSSYWIDRPSGKNYCQSMKNQF